MTDENIYILFYVLFLFYILSSSQKYCSCPSYSSVLLDRTAIRGLGSYGAELRSQGSDLRVKSTAVTSGISIWIRIQVKLIGT
jgi:hypothetical protein